MRLCNNSVMSVVYCVDMSVQRKLDWNVALRPSVSARDH